MRTENHFLEHHVSPYYSTYCYMNGLVLFNIHNGSQHAQYPEYNHNNKWNVIHTHMHFVPIKNLAL